MGDNLAPRTIWHLGQFGTEDNFAPGQFGTKSVKEDNLAPRTIWHQECKIGQFGTRTIWHRTIWHREQFGTTDNLAPDNLAPGQFGTNIIKQTIWHQEKNGIQIIV